MIEVFKDRGTSNNDSHPKQAPDPSHPDVSRINRTEAEAIDTDAVSKYMTETDKSVVVLSTKSLIPEGQAEQPTYSYKVTVRSENVEAILKPEFWPNDIGCH